MPRYTNLTRFITEHNSWAGVISGVKLNTNTDQSRQQIASEIDSALSPENLSCDGELAVTQVRERYQFLTRAARELKLMDPGVTFYEYAE